MHDRLKIDIPVQITIPPSSRPARWLQISPLFIGSPTPFRCGVLFYRTIDPHLVNGV